MIVAENPEPLKKRRQQTIAKGPENAENLSQFDAQTWFRDAHESPKPTKAKSLIWGLGTLRVCSDPTPSIQKFDRPWLSDVASEIHRILLSSMWGLIKIMGPFGVCIIVYSL